MTTLQIRGKGTITLPASLRKKYKLEEGGLQLGEKSIERETAMKYNRLFLLPLLLFSMACICGGLAPTPSDYVPLHPGDCFVPPQGDPVYDQFYAQNVNPDNCRAYENQSQGHLNEAQSKLVDSRTRKIETETSLNLAGASAVTVIAVVFIVLVVIGIIRG